MIMAFEVETIFKDCLWSEKELDAMAKEHYGTLNYTCRKVLSALRIMPKQEHTQDSVYLQNKSIELNGLMLNVAFNPAKIEKHKDRIEEILEKVSPDFHVQTGGGASFLKLPFDKVGNQWGEHRNAEQLMLLGMAIKKVKYALESRTFWGAMPGGLPYLMVNLEGFNKET